MDRSPEAIPRIDMAVVAWAVLVFGLLFLGLLPLYVLHLDLAKLLTNPQTLTRRGRAVSSGETRAPIC